MKREYKVWSNSQLDPIPDDRTVLAAVLECEDDLRMSEAGVSAQRVAWKLGIQPARRLGRGAVKGSWTGHMAPALRIAPRLRSLTKRGLLREHWGSRRIEWRTTEAGRKALRA